MILCCSSHMRVDKTHRNVEAEVGQGEQELPDVQFSGVGGVGVKGAPGEPVVHKITEWGSWRESGPSALPVWSLAMAVVSSTLVMWWRAGTRMLRMQGVVLW